MNSFVRLAMIMMVASPINEGLCLFAAVISAWADSKGIEVIVVGFKLKCPMSGCSTELQAETKEELMTQGMAHAKTHGMAAMSPDMMAKVQAAIKQT
jgi:predicted small metal-binding protein